MVQQHEVIKSLLEEGDAVIEIDLRLMQHCRDRAISRSEVYPWVIDIKGGRIDLEMVSSPGWMPDQGLTDADGIKKIPGAPALSARKRRHIDSGL
jgi:hypothetical protein